MGSYSPITMDHVQPQTKPNALRIEQPKGIFQTFLWILEFWYLKNASLLSIIVLILERNAIIREKEQVFGVFI